MRGARQPSPHAALRVHLEWMRTHPQEGLLTLAEALERIANTTWGAPEALLLNGAAAGLREAVAKAARE